MGMITGDRANCFSRSAMRVMLPLASCWILLAVFVPSLLAQQDDGSPWHVPVKTVAIITEDDQGVPLQFPSVVFFDKTMDETYVVTGGKGRISVYGADYFPKISLGVGRGVETPNGLYVADDGRLFVCQGQSAGKPPRLTILNGAFFLEKEITFADIPGAESFIPGRLSVGINGNMYIVPTNMPGALVLDKEGKFLRWLKPKDKVQVEEEAPVAGEGVGGLRESESLDNATEEGEPQAATPQAETSQAGNEEPQPRDQRAAEMEGLPEFLRPVTKEAEEGANVTDPAGAVQLTDVVCDSKGHIYLLSEETSKVYVYNAAEQYLFSFGQKGGSEGKMSRPRALAVDEEKKSIYVVDYMRHTILLYNFAGRFLFEIGGFGRSPRWFNFPTDLALNRQGNLIVADLFNKRVQVLDVQFEASVSLFGPGDKSAK